MKSKQILISFLVMGNILVTVPSFATTAEPPVSSYISINVYGDTLFTDVPAALINGRVLAPFRAIFESLGAKVTWDYDLNMAVAKRDSKEIELIINSQDAWVNKQKMRLDVAPMIISDRTMVPVRFISEALGEPVRWDENTRTVYIGEQTVPEDTSWTKEYTLSKDSSLAYRPGQFATFQAGTLVIMRSKDFVGNATLKDDYVLPLSNRRETTVTFKAGTSVSFNEQGYVNQGTIAQEASIAFAFIDSVSVDLLPYKNRNQILLKINSLIELDKDGYLTRGILATDTDIPYSDKGIVSLKGDTQVSILSGGLVSKGTLNKKNILPIAQNQTAPFKYGTSIEFINSKVIKGTLDDDYEMRYREGYDANNMAWFKNNTIVEMNERGCVKRGVLAKDSSLYYQTNRVVFFEKGTSVEFYDNGFVRQGYLKTNAVLPTSSTSSQNFNAGSLITFGSEGFASEGIVNKE